MMAGTEFQRTDSESGVSEAIGFLIMFSIVVTGIAMVTLYAYPLLLQSQINSDERTMEQTMISLQNEMKILTYSNVPYRDLAVRVSGGFLDAFDSSKSKDSFMFDYPDSSGNSQSYTFSPGYLRYTSGEGDAVYTIENGAVLSRQKFQEGSVMVAEPRWYYDESAGTLVILLTKISADRDYSLSGIGNVRMSMLSEPVTVTDESYNTGPVPVYLTYSPDSSDDLSAAWKNYLTGDSFSGGNFGDYGSNTYNFTGVKRLVIKEYNIKIEDL
ncbi:hypothetical protein J2128_001710 [Methanomicrobium sp. W14]|uniref:DUF7289 family protein n=1 Tax=Methanomicrobium sp. W14 TaxID=2817839 RepID=UPI001AE15F02|nr:hypothetical protein [Methanomicrobium sp. W14]MBP2133756.1 hypothetical protein [Methanomicrobium sp. W14]